MAKSKSPHDLRILKKDEIVECFEFQKKEGIWDFYSEREFLENTLNQRVNFAIAVFALVFASAFQVSEDWKSCLIFLFGAGLMYLLYLSALRIHARLDIVLKILYKIDKRHVFQTVKKELNAHKVPGIQTKNTYVGIPLYCLIVLSIGFSIQLFRILQPLLKQLFCQ